MKPSILLLIVLAAFITLKAQNIYKSQTSEITFFSSSPLEDIEAKSTKAVSAIDFDKKTMAFKVPINTFQFKSKLMQEHFNENYMQSDKFPFSQFNGTFTGDVNLTQNGNYPITVTGNLTIHGVTKKYTVAGKILVVDGKVAGNATFNVLLKDHNIEIPKVVTKNIAESIKITVNVGYAKN